MADFNVQHIASIIAANESEVTLTAGTDYTAPTDAANAWVIIRANNANGEGLNASGFGGVDDWGTWCINAGNIATSLTFRRGFAHINAARFHFEIHEYVGSPGGNNEIELLGSEVLTLGASDLTADTSVHTPSADDNVFVQVAGQGVTTPCARGQINPGWHTGDWIDASNLGRATRGVTGSETSHVHINLLDHSGANWGVQRVEHSYVGTSAETEPIASVGSLTRAFCDYRQRGTTNSTTGRNVGSAFMSAVNELTFQTDQVATTNIHAAWVIENTDTSADAMSVQRISDFTFNGLGDDISYTDGISNLSDVAQSCVSSITAHTTSGTHSDSYKGQIGCEITSATLVTLYQGNSQENRNYQVEVTTYPTTSSSAIEASGSPSIPAITATGQADITHDASGAVSIPSITATGQVETGRDASGSVEIPSLTASGVAERSVEASGPVSIPSISASGSANVGEAVYNASGTSIVPSITATGVAQTSSSAFGDVTLPAIVASGVVTRAAETTSGNVSIPAVTAVGAAIIEQFASGVAVVPAITATGTAAVGGAVVESPFYGTGCIIDAELTGCVIDINGTGYVIDLALIGVIRGED